MVPCNYCGSEMPEDASFCPKCGGQAKAGPYASPNPWGWKYTAKYAAKAERRASKNARHAWRWGLRASPEWGLLNALTGGLLVIVLGGLLYLVAAGISPLVTWSNVWAYLLLAIGVLITLRGVASVVLFGGFFRLGGILWGIFLIAVSLAWLSATVAGWGPSLWAAVIVLGGLLIIVAGVGSYLVRKMASHD